MNRLDRLFAPNFPFRPASLPFFYGWAIVVAGTGGMLFSLPGQTAGVGAFKEPLQEALGVTSLELAGAYMVGTIISGLTLPKIGGVFDRIGARKVATASALGLALSLFYLSQSDKLMRALLGGGANSMVALIIVSIGFFAIRFFGQGILTMVSRAMIGKWFDRQRGLASAISGMPVSIVFSSALFVFFILIDALGGWREAWIAVGVFLMTFGAFFCWLIFRDNPEECGLLMDGRDANAPIEAAETNAEFIIHREFTEREALKTRAFWVFSLAICLNGFVGTAVPFHAERIAGNAGMSKEAFSLLFPQSVLVNIATSFLIGWMTGRFRLKYAYFVMLGGQALGITGISFLPTLPGQAMCILGFGASWGAFGTLSTVTWPRYFGRRHLGKISGWVMLLMVVTSALGPFFFAGVEFATGDFKAAFTTSLILCGVLVAYCIGTENPQRRHAP